ncbi:hypothetical protein ACOMHN_016300 [Nucella lapillus]
MISFQYVADVQYFNAKKVVIGMSMHGEAVSVPASSSRGHHNQRETRPKVKGTIDFLPADKTWGFGRENLNLSINTSTVHVPTNIYDKLCGVVWYGDKTWGFGHENLNLSIYTSTVHMPTNIYDCEIFAMKILNGVQWSENLTDQFKVNSLKYPTLRWQYFCSSDGFFRIFPGMQWPRDPEKVDVFDCRMQKWYIQAASTPKNIIILLDTSGSMMGKRFTIAQSTVSTILDTLSDEDYFNIIKYSKEPEYVDPCFNGTMMPANVDNIRRMQGKIMDISNKGTADLRKALNLAFRLFKEVMCIIMDISTKGTADLRKALNLAFRLFKEVMCIIMDISNKGTADLRKARLNLAFGLFKEIVDTSTRADRRKALSLDFRRFKEGSKSTTPCGYKTLEEKQADNGSICNKAIMIITDGAPENYEDVYNKSNWPQKATRIFTYLIGKEVSDDRKVQWMACANKGQFTHISTKADVQENVQQYIKVLSRPLAQNKSDHSVWSAVYLDYPTMQSEISTTPMIINIDPAYEQMASFKGMGLVISFAMPVFDPRSSSKVGKQEDNPQKNLLGVVGTDVRINDIIKLIPNYRLGVNGYAFAVTNHGYVLFHPDFRPFFKSGKSLELRPKYNSVDLSEVEIPYNHGESGEHPLRKYLLTSLEGGLTTTQTVLTHFDGMKRVKLQKNSYQFIAVANTFRLVFVVPDKYGNKIVKLDDSALQNLTKGDKDLLRHILLDYRYTMGYDALWNGSRFDATTRNFSFDPIRYGIDLVWIGTASGFTRYMPLQMVAFDDRYTATIHSLYYRQAVFGWDEGLPYVFYMDGHRSNLQIVMTTAEVIGHKKSKAPVAATAFRMGHSNFEDIFNQVTAECPGKHKCSYTCKDKDKGIFLGKRDATMMKELIRHGYFFELNVTDYQAMCTSHISNQDSSSSFIMTVSSHGDPCTVSPPVLSFHDTPMKQDVSGRVFLAEWTLHGWLYIQSVVSKNTEARTNTECGKNYPSTVRYFLCNVVVNKSSHQPYNTPYTLDNHACVMTRSRYALNTTLIKTKKQFHGALTDCGECSRPQTVSYSVHWLEHTNLIMIMAAADCKCDTANDTFLTNTHEVSYILLPHTEDQQCERLFSFSRELKRVDNTRTTNALCLDSRDEDDYTCGHAGLNPRPLTNCCLLLLAFVFSFRLFVC